MKIRNLIIQDVTPCCTEEGFDALKKTTAISIFLLIAFLMVAHGFEEQTGFKIDFITITLLLILGIPLLRPFVDTIKAGNLEMQFRALQEERPDSRVSRRHCTGQAVDIL